MVDTLNEQQHQPENGRQELDKTLDLLWQQSFVTQYDTLFQEIRYEILLKWLQVADTSTAWIAAVTATGTGIGGWALWDVEGGKYIWACIAAIASLVAITHAVLKVADRHKQHMDVFRNLRAIRRGLESFRQSIRRDQIAPTPQKTLDADARYRMIRAEYEKVDLVVAPSGLLDARAEYVQDEVDKRLKIGGWL